MHILIAPNAFKNALSASDASECIREGLTKSKLKFISTVFPVADGGDGTGALLIELAGTCGLRLMKPNELNPMHASTWGAGELIKMALDKKANRILLCIGGSCTTDAGTGILQTLGIRFLDRNGHELLGMPESLLQLETIDSSQLDMRMSETELILLCDVQ